MCGIFCSNDLNTFEILEQANRKRGNFSTGIFYMYNKSTYKIVKKEGGVNFDETKLPSRKGFLYLGHNQAPTQTGREWADVNSHPFSYGDWFVAHNGIITNFNELVDQHSKFHTNPVDSSIIPGLLDEFEYASKPCEKPKDEQKLIIRVLEKLEGTFAVWIVNIKTMNVYIARQGSTLFYRGSNVSSIKGKHYREVKEGVLYSYSYEGLTKVNTFKSKSPFLTL